MMSFGCGAAMGRLAASLMILGAVLLLAACGGSDGGRLDDAVEPEMPMTELGGWNTPIAGSLDVDDTNGVLRAHYDSAGAGHIEADMPVQPVVTGTATWTGMWSGRVELNPDPLTTVGLAAFGVDAGSFEQLGGAAQVTAYLGDDGVTAELTYRDLGLDDIGLMEITSERVPVIDGLFEPVKMYTHIFDYETPDPTDPTAPTMVRNTAATGDFAGEGVFGGANAAGVAGYVGGRIDIEYGLAPIYLGTLQSVFYGTRDQN